MLTRQDGSSQARTALDMIRNSVSLSLAVWGAVIVVAGYVIQDGVWPAMMAVWGSGLVLVGITAYTLIWWGRR